MSWQSWFLRLARMSAEFKFYRMDTSLRNWDERIVSLAIEHNTLSLDQVTAIIDGKRVLGNPNEIREVRNAYELLLELNPLSIDDLLKAHRLMMSGLVPENGRFRSESIGVFDGNQIIHMAPPAELVSGQIHDLISWYQESCLTYQKRSLPLWVWVHSSLCWWKWQVRKNVAYTSPWKMEWTVLLASNWGADSIETERILCCT